MKKLILAFLVVSVFACNDDDGDKPLSDLAELLEFTVESSSDFTPVKTFIDSEKGEVRI